MSATDDETKILMNRDEAEEYTQALGQVLSGGWRQTLLAERLGVHKALGLTLREWQESRLGGYVRLSVTERRDAVEELTQNGMSQREIADVLGVDAATVNRDLKPTVANATPEPADADFVQVDEPDELPTVANATLDSQPEKALPIDDDLLTPAAIGWHRLGEHLLYCGDSTDPEFIAACQASAFAFADPPYNAGKADWDESFTWQHDYIADAAAIVAVTPGIASLAGFLAKTEMPYRWSMAAEITNGMTSGALRFGNWICITLFAHGSIYRKAKDHVRIPVATGDDHGGTHPSRKPIRLLTHLIELFTTKGDTIIDPFLGSGTTLIAAERTGRRCVGAEIDPTHCAEIIARYEAEAS